MAREWFHAAGLMRPVRLEIGQTEGNTLSLKDLSLEVRISLKYRDRERLSVKSSSNATLERHLSRAARRCTTAAEELCTTGTMRKD